MGKETNGRPPLKDMFRGKGSWNFPIWYLLLVFVTLWVWQSVLGQMTVREIPYSEFKMHLKRGEVTDAVVKDETVEGRIQLHTADSGPVLMGSNNVSATTNAPAKIAKASADKFLFRSVRVEDPKLVEDLETANVKYRGERPSLLTQFLFLHPSVS